MFSMLLMLDPVAETLVLPSKCHLVTQRWTQVGPLCPQEVLKRLGSASEPVAQGEGQHLSNHQGHCAATQSCLRVVAVWQEPTPNRVWKGAVLV